jgi:hypothetical protein
MKTTNEVIKAIQDGDPVSDIEMKCALIAMHSYRMSFYFDLARFCVEVEDEKGVQPKTTRGLKRAWANQEWLDRDLESFVLNSSKSPLLTKEEQKNLFIKKTSDTAVKLFEVLSGGKK